MSKILKFYGRESGEFFRVCKHIQIVFLVPCKLLREIVIFILLFEGDSIVCSEMWISCESLVSILQPISFLFYLFYFYIHHTKENYYKKND